MEDLMATHGLDLANAGYEPTFVARGTQSTIDITLLLNTTVENWKVTDEVSMSDHRPIHFSLNMAKPTTAEIPNLKKNRLGSFQAHN